MNATKTRIRMPRALITVGCLAALAGPGSAAAMLPNGDSSVAVRHENGPAAVAPAGASDSSGARLDHRGLQTRQYVLPMSHHADVPGPSAPAGAEPTYSLPSNFKTDAQTQAPSSSPSSSPGTVTREIRTVTDDGNRTLALVLAACALGVALCGTGFAAIRLAQIQRRVVGSSS